jgi:hypothetical protein
LLLLSVSTLGILSLTFLLLFSSSASGSIRSRTALMALLDAIKVHLVARDFQQQYGHDYEETFPPVAHRATVHTLIEVVSIRRWTISQLN